MLINTSPEDRRGSKRAIGQKDSLAALFHEADGPAEAKMALPSDDLLEMCTVLFNPVGHSESI
jgi:hypothetical protein